jgi:polyphosphate kinase 2 (PPK2 family)
MVRMQQWAVENKRGIIIIFEGRDSAGKGGAIMRFIRFINPIHYLIVALQKPTDIEMHEWYFQRYLKHPPEPGEIVFFDRSCYNRGVVGSVMGFCTKERYELFLKQVNVLENMLLVDGIEIIKF